MFNTSNHSSERSTRQTQQRRDSSYSQRGSSTHKSRSPSSSRRSDSRSKWKAPVWVHCEKCYGTSSDSDSDLFLFSCLHIFCNRCLRIAKSTLPTEALPCLICKTQLPHRCLDSSLESKLNGMFQESWMDAVLQISLKNLQFMMAKTQNYLTFISKSMNRNQGLPGEWKERYNSAKKIAEQNEKLKKLENEIITKSEAVKAEAIQYYTNIKVLRSIYEKKKKSETRQSDKRQQTIRGNSEKDMKFVSSGRNEHSNQYIGQLKSSHRPINQNQSAANIRGLSQKTVPQVSQRPNQTFNQYRLEIPKVPPEKPIIRSAKFRPKTRDFKSDNHRFEPQSHAQKRLAPSYDYDEYTTPSKRATNYPIRRETNLDTSNTSSGGSSLRLNDSRFNPHAKSIGSAKYSNRHANTSRNITFQESDLLIGGRNSLTRMQNKRFTQTIPYHQDELTWCVPEATTLSLWLNIFLIFDGETWGYFMFTLLASGTALYYFYKFYSHQENWCYCSAVGFFVTVSMSVPIKLLRTYFLIFCIYGVLVTATFNSFLMSTITNPVKYTQISTKQGLINNSMELYAENETFYLYNTGGRNKFSEYFMPNVRSCSDMNGCLNTFLSTLSNNIAIAASREHAMNYPLLNESKNIYVYSVAALAHEHFHLLEAINRQIQIAVESGLIIKWESDSKLLKKPKVDITGPYSFSFHHISGCIVALAVGYTLATVAFALECYFASKKITVTTERNAWSEIFRYVRWKNRLSNSFR